MSQDNSSESPLNRALELNGQLESMRAKNVTLYDQNQELIERNKDLIREREGMVQLVKALNEELDNLKTTSTAKEKRLYAELKNMQTSWDSLYEEHRSAEERRERELRAKNANANANGKKVMTEEEKIDQQAELLRSACAGKKKSTTLKKKVMVSPMEQKLHEVEDENNKLKSRIVQLQTKYKEEKYKNENGIKESDSPSTTDSDSLGSLEKSPVPNRSSITNFSKLNVGRRQTTSNAPRAPKFTQSTKSLWGRMTINRTLKQPTNFEFSPVNLAFSREN